MLTKKTLTEEVVLNRDLMVTAIKNYRSMGMVPFPVCKPLSKDNCIQHLNCNSIGKVPLILNWSSLSAANEKELDVLFEQFKWNCNIGLLTGTVGNLVVLDVDGSEGWDSLISCGIVDQEANQAECYSGATIITGRVGGYHYWFNPAAYYPKKIGFLPKLDFIGEGGYVLAPPSIHKSGNSYTFKGDTFDLSLKDKYLPDIPEWIVDLTQKSSSYSSTVIDLPLSSSSKVKLGQRCITFLASGARSGQREELVNAVVNMVGQGFDAEEIERRVVHAILDLSPNTDASRPWTVDDVVKVVEEFTTQGVREARGIDSNHSINLTVKGSKRMVTGKSKRLTDLLKQYQEEEEREWLIEGIIHRGEFLWLFAPPNSGKTFVAMDWALHVSSGREYQGYLSVERGKVLIIEQDRALDPVRYLEAHLEGGSWDIKDIEENLYISVQEDFSLKTEEGLLELLGYIDSEKPDLLILDACYSFCLNGISDGDYEFVHRFKEGMVARGIAVIMLDHTVATPEFEGNSSKTDLDKLYGGSAKRKLLDTGIYMKGYLRDGVVDLNWAKVQGVQPDNLRLKFTPREGFQLKVLFSPDKHSYTKLEIEIVEYLSRHGPRSIVELSEALDHPERSLRRALGPMVIRRMVDRRPDGIFSLGTALRQPRIELEEEELNAERDTSQGSNDRGWTFKDKEASRRIS